jgi:hypothetical protein
LDNPEYVSIFIWTLAYLSISLLTKWIVSWGGASFLESWSASWSQFDIFPEESGTKSEIIFWSKCIWLILTIWFVVGLFRPESRVL